MDSREPPALATWLLDRLGYAHENPALAGDLLEEFQTGRSAAWYWRQTAMVMLKTPGRKGIAWLCSRALLAGYLAQLPVVYCLWRLHTLPRVHGVPGWTLASLLSAFALILAIFLRAAIAGGRFPDDLRRLLWIQGNLSPVRRAVATGLFVQAFGECVLVYCLVATFQPADLQPFGGLIGAQIALLGLQVLRLCFWVVAPIGIRFPHDDPSRPIRAVQIVRGWLAVLTGISWPLFAQRSHDGLRPFDVVVGIVISLAGGLSLLRRSRLARHQGNSPRPIR